jgi:hypothetical protein
MARASLLIHDLEQTPATENRMSSRMAKVRSARMAQAADGGTLCMLGSEVAAWAMLPNASTIRRRCEMKRRTLLLVASVSGLVVAALLLVGGLVMQDNANFAVNYTAEQLGQEKITFKAADKLTAAEMEFTNERTGCVVAYAGQAVTTGRQAECFANEYILGHLLDPEKTNEGLTFAEWGDIQAGLRAQIAAAKETGDPGLVALEEELAASEIARNSAFRGAMLRGTLLATYGFGVLGEKAAAAAVVAFIAAAALLLLSVIGLAVAFVARRGEIQLRRVAAREQTKPAAV